MDQTPNLDLSYILPSQAQKHVTHNEALGALDTLVQLVIRDLDLSSPPTSPQEGDRYRVKPPAAGAWSGKGNTIAAFRDGAWHFSQPRTGWLAWIADDEELTYWDGAAWTPVSEAIAELAGLAKLGVGTSADATNPFSAKLNNALWAARTVAEGGDGDLRYKLNKEGPTDVLSMLFQSNWSGRAELGLVGSDDFGLKVSANGTDWKRALRVDRATGNVDVTAGTVSVASAPTCDIGAAAGLRVSVTGTTTITSLGSEPDTLRFLQFGGALVLTHNATTLKLPGGANIVTEAGDCAIAASDASGNWRLLHYQRANRDLEPRRRLAATRTVWVTGSLGNDSTGALYGGDTFAHGFATIQAAIDWAYAFLDAGGARNRYSITIEIYHGGGPYTAPLTISGPLPGDGLLHIHGQPGGTTAITVTGNHAITVKDGAKVLVGNVRLKTITSGAALYVDGGKATLTSGLEFDTCAASQIDVSNHGTVSTQDNYSIIGGAVSHFHARNMGVMILSKQVTLTGTPAFSAYFAGCSFGYVEAIGASFVGSATGTRFVVHYDGCIRTVVNAPDSDLNLFPGSLAGSADRGGLYDDYGKSPSRIGNYGAKTAAFQVVVPKYHRIAAITLLESNGAAVTGGINIGTTNGGSDVVAAHALGANGFVEANVLKRIFSASADTTLYVTAVTSWNGAAVTLGLLYDRLN